MQEFVLGLDIGYSNMKLTMGYKDDEPRTVIMPVGAGPLKLMPQQLIGVSLDIENYCTLGSFFDHQ
ncbi:hypothetical protein [Edwardsiella anguillarum]|uniref:Rod shape determination protein n=1 Tax=Edwardsiella anguillarum ET080813 TaxID=667120 RepID=A0A076LZ61_9GAMM|nr:Rod shape determination protein [Edwardsiella anguillarum ET080813]